MDNAVLMEIEKLRRASMARPAREVSRGVSGGSANAGTGNICSGGLPGGCRPGGRGSHRTSPRRGRRRSPRMPTCERSRRETSLALKASRSRQRRGTGIAGSRIAGCRCRERCSAGNGKDGRFWWRFWRRDSDMRTSSTPRSAPSRFAITGTRWNGLAFFGLTRRSANSEKIIVRSSNPKRRSHPGSPALRDLHSQIDRGRPRSGI